MGSNSKCPYKNRRQAETHRIEHQVKTEAGLLGTTYQPKCAKHCPQPPEARREE